MFNSATNLDVFGANRWIMMICIIKHWSLHKANLILKTRKKISSIPLLQRKILSNQKTHIDIYKPEFL